MGIYPAACSDPEQTPKTQLIHTPQLAVVGFLIMQKISLGVKPRPLGRNFLHEKTISFQYRKQIVVCFRILVIVNKCSKIFYNHYT